MWARYIESVGSIICPYVSLLIIPSGFPKNVGTIPDSSMSSLYSARTIPRVPFCAERDTNLSPSVGYLLSYVWTIYSSGVDLRDDTQLYLHGYVRS